MTENILSWYNNPDLKQAAIDGMRAHRIADELVKGHYIHVDGAFSGCAVGCVLRDLAELGPTNSEDNPHEQYSNVAGLPLWIAHLHDHFFEVLPHPDNQQFAEDLLIAIPVGVDLTTAYHKFMIWLLTDDIHGSRQYCDDDGKSATDAVVSLHKRLISGDMPVDKEWAAARNVAGAAQSNALIRILSEST